MQYVNKSFNLTPMKEIQFHQKVFKDFKDVQIGNKFEKPKKLMSKLSQSIDMNQKSLYNFRDSKFTDSLINFIYNDNSI